MTRSSPSNPATPVPSANRTPALLVPPEQRVPEQFAERTDHGQRQRIDHGHLGDPEAHGGGGDLAADEPGADDDHAGAGPGQLVPQAPRVGEGADRVPAGERTGAGQPAGPHTGGDDQTVVRERRAVVQLHGPLGEAGGDDLRAEPPLHVGHARAGTEGQRLEGAFPASTSLESGGRLYGMCGSSPTTVTAPVHPAARSCSAARRPAMEAPATTMRVLTDQASIRMAWSGQTSAASSTSSRSASSGSLT